MSHESRELEPWRRAWRALVPHLPTEGLQRLADALAGDDPRLITGGTTWPAPGFGARTKYARGACPLAYCGWLNPEATVGAVYDFFTDLPNDKSREFTAWVDGTSRSQMRAALLPEVQRALARRAEPEAETPVVVRIAE